VAPNGQAIEALILVVERDPHIRELEQFFLNEAGFAVEFVDDGASALSRARELRPQIVVTEILIPKVDGLTLCRRLKQDAATKEIIVVIFSVLAAAQRSQESGADAFLMKPLEEGRLVSTVRDLLALRLRGNNKET
jgi:CheY-like chemotaxis protein